MKYLLFCSFVLGSTFLKAQKNIIPSDHFTVEGKVKNVVDFTLKDAQAFGAKTIDSIVITNHLLERRGVIKKINGVLLRNILKKAEIDAENPRVLSEYYVECIATDNYKVVFSWNEVFNSEVGDYILVITQKDGEDIRSYDDRIAIISAKDQATGRRFVKGLQKVLVKRVE